ncbi:S8 family serine peptidase [Actinoallomurus spadix]|uniref:Type VII secretion-associated serine protease mycosin n=1 Tax=Actinoallomurus spadix TaxID=79912 RepID=A0ABN0XLF5_9ACTN
MTGWARRVSALCAALAIVGTTAAPAGALPRPRDEEWWFSAWAITGKVWSLSQGDGVTVALLDTGVNAGLPELDGAVVPGTDTTGRGGDGRTDIDVESQGHGTSMAALIAGQGGRTGMVGVAPHARILPVVVTNGREGDLANSLPPAIRYAADHGAKVINMSQANPASMYPGHCPSGLREAIAYALRRDVVVVAGAGNTGSADNAPQLPAACPGVLAVGALDNAKGVWDKTQRQDYVSVAAPGVHVGVLLANGTFDPEYSGTSQAAALTSGAVALLRSRYPDMRAPEVVRQIVGTAKDVGAPGPDTASGYGVVIPGAALQRQAPAGAGYPVVRQMEQLASSGAPADSAGPSSPKAPAGRHNDGGGGIPPLVLFGVGLCALIIVVAVVAAARRRSGGTPPPDDAPPAPGSPSRFVAPPHAGAEPDRTPPPDVAPPGGTPTFLPPVDPPGEGRH